MRPSCGPHKPHTHQKAHKFCARLCGTSPRKTVSFNINRWIQLDYTRRARVARRVDCVGTTLIFLPMSRTSQLLRWKTGIGQVGHSERVPAKLLIHESEKFTKILNFGYREPGAIAVLSAKSVIRKVALARFQIIVLRWVYPRNGSDVPREHFVKGTCTSWMDRQTDRSNNNILIELECHP